MGLSIDRRVVLTTRSDRVKAVDFHPNDPIMASALYNGTVAIWNYISGSTVRTISVSSQPVRAVAFIARRGWIATGSDDLKIRIYSISTGELLYDFEAHADYIRAILPHPTRSILLSASDDMTIREWDWDRGWKCICSHEGHAHYVMDISINPRDNGATFATVSLDRTVKVWTLGGSSSATTAAAAFSSQTTSSVIVTSTPNFSMDSGEKGLNTVAYLPSSDNRPYFVVSGDDGIIRIWDYVTRSCVRSLEVPGLLPITSVAVHPTIPLLIAAGEDGQCRFWNSQTFSPEFAIAPGIERIWSMAVHPTGSAIIFGADDGAAVWALGTPGTPSTMDASGRLFFCRGKDVNSSNLRQAVEDAPREAKEASQSEAVKIFATIKDLGTIDIFPTSISHAPNGRFVAVCGDGEYTIYSTLAWRSKSFGKAQQVVWSSDSNSLLLRLSTPTGNSTLISQQNFVESASLQLSSACENIFGGPLAAAACAGNQLYFFDWTFLSLIRSIDVAAKHLCWSGNGKKVAVCSDSSIYLLEYDASTVEYYKSISHDKQSLPEDGVEEAFNLLAEVNEHVISAFWWDDVFYYLSSNNCLSYILGTRSFPIKDFATCHQFTSIAGVISESISQDREVKQPNLQSPFAFADFHDSPSSSTSLVSTFDVLILLEKDANPFMLPIPSAMINYQKKLLSEGPAAAQPLIHLVPQSQHNKIARLLQSMGFVDEAESVATDPDLRFALALSRGKLSLAAEILSNPATDSPERWLSLADVSLANRNYQLAEQAFIRAQDLSSLALLYAAGNNQHGLVSVGMAALEQKDSSLAFTCLFAGGKLMECFHILLNAGRIPEAALLAKNYIGINVDHAASAKANPLKVALSLWRNANLKSSIHALHAILPIDCGNAHTTNLSEHFPLANQPFQSPKPTHSFPLHQKIESDASDANALSDQCNMIDDEHVENDPSPFAQSFNLEAARGKSFSRPRAFSIESGPAAPPLSSTGTNIESITSDQLSMEVHCGNQSMRSEDFDDFPPSNYDGPLPLSDGEMDRTFENLSIADGEHNPVPTRTNRLPLDALTEEEHGASDAAMSPVSINVSEDVENLVGHIDGNGTIADSADSAWRPDNADGDECVQEDIEFEDADGWE